MEKILVRSVDKRSFGSALVDKWIKQVSPLVQCQRNEKGDEDEYFNAKFSFRLCFFSIFLGSFVQTTGVNNKSRQRKWTTKITYTMRKLTSTRGTCLVCSFSWTIVTDDVDRLIFEGKSTRWKCRVSETVQMPWILPFVDGVFEKQFFHAEECQARHQTITARLMLRTNAFNLEKTRMTPDESNGEKVSRCTSSCFATSSRPPLRFLQLFIKYLTS